MGDAVNHPVPGQPKHPLVMAGGFAILPDKPIGIIPVIESILAFRILVFLGCLGLYPEAAIELFLALPLLKYASDRLRVHKAKPGLALAAMVVLASVMTGVGLILG